MSHSKLEKSIRIIFGILIIGSGLAMLFGLIPTDMYQSQPANHFMQAMYDTGYFYPFLAIVKIVCGLCIVTNRYSYVALIIFMPVAINMVMFHLFLAPAEGLPAYLILAMNVYLMVHRLPVYRLILRKK
ncbi:MULTISPECIES: DoxX family membrane protein [Staphylococcus]|uniref:DoxX family membrane protein n=1 Tax=Staphylococcus TaxID=1279 RepID=UPI0008D1E4B2|nr:MULTISPECIES: DoxX family membrane protein [Staphylococcus]ARB76943.1 DoxX family membrane protein [Staphylococcus lugdunensis]ARJ17990.1 hypothetical protein B7467_02915 [Staphylococcus lugdunensis]MBM7134724.1 DoxX family membrane protein [Staphylococcus lugdunensis]MCH8643028.1 DoxX family membrane protein [Staphylococcus lugdunensis]MCH8645346.1 DoxX family membrane protein [Staphylococcus lugdunensis]